MSSMAASAPAGPDPPKSRLVEWEEEDFLAQPPPYFTRHTGRAMGKLSLTKDKILVQVHPPG